MSHAVHLLKAACAMLAACTPLCFAAKTYDLSFITDQTDGNLVGIAVNPTNGNMVVNAAGRSNQNDIWVLSPDGALLSATRVPTEQGFDQLLTGITFGPGESLYGYANKGDTSQSGPFERNVLRLSPDGSQIVSSFGAAGYGTGGVGMTYDPANQTLLISSYARQAVDVASLSGELLATGTLLYRPYDIAVDPVTRHLFVLRGESAFIDEYSRGADGSLAYLTSYLFESGYLSLEFDRTSGDLFLLSDQAITRLGRDELVPVSSVPMPPSALMLVAGLAAVAAASRRERRRSASASRRFASSAAGGPSPDAASHGAALMCLSDTFRPAALVGGTNGTSAPNPLRRPLLTAAARDRPR